MKVIKSRLQPIGSCLSGRGNEGKRFRSSLSLGRGVLNKREIRVEKIWLFYRFDTIIISMFLSNTWRLWNPHSEEVR